MTEKRELNQRLEVVDALRGFALSTLFLVHVMESYELYWAHPSPSVISDTVFLLFLGKSFSLLAMCFGFSFHILMSRAAARGEDFSRRFAWRLIVLAGIGYFHAVIYRGDIMMTLAALGLLLIPVERIRNNRILAGMALLCFLGPTLLFQLLAAALGADWANQAALSSYDPGMPVYLDGDFVQTVLVNLWPAQVPKFAYFLEFGRLPQIFGLYLVGMILGRTRFFARIDEYRWQRRGALAVAIVVTLVLQFGREPARLAFADMGYSAGAQRAFWTLLSTWLELAGTSVWALVVIEAWQHFHRWLAPLAAMGRLTLTFYVAQSVVFVPLFYNFGLGLHDDLSAAARLGIGLLGIAAQMALATWWLRHFAYGPLEWVWRALTYWRRDIPFRKRPDASQRALAQRTVTAS